MNRDDDELRALLDTVGDADGPSDEALGRVRSRVMARVGLAAGAGAGATLAASSAVAKTGLLGAATWKLGASVVALVATVTVGGAYYAASTRDGASATAATTSHGEHTPEASARAASDDLAPAPSAPAARAGEPAPSAAPTTTSADAPKEAGTGASALARSPHEGPRAGPSGDRLGDEVKLLDKAQSALQTGKARDAMSALDEHATGHEGGALAEERAAARVFALCRLGRVDDARALTTQFLATWPRSPHASTLKSSCGGASTSP